jgi:hypothetical protein
MPLTDMQIALDAALADDAARTSSSGATMNAAVALTARLPLVHRTCKPGFESKWRDLLGGGRFAAAEPCTEREKHAGIPRAV